MLLPKNWNGTTICGSHVWYTLVAWWLRWFISHIYGKGVVAWGWDGITIYWAHLRQQWCCLRVDMVLQSVGRMYGNSVVAWKLRSYHDQSVMYGNSVLVWRMRWFHDLWLICMATVLLLGRWDGVTISHMYHNNVVAWGLRWYDGLLVTCMTIVLLLEAWWCHNLVSYMYGNIVVAWRLRWYYNQ